jgi:hypothetical protein
LEVNRHAADGRDPLFCRGESAQERYLDDPSRPHPCLAPLTEGPFHAIRIRPGTLGTCGDLDTDDDGRVLDRAGSPSRAVRRGQHVGHRLRRRLPGRRCHPRSAVTRAFAVGRTLAAQI